MHIKITNLSHRFTSDVCVLDDINLDDDCTSIAIIGPSGSGKSTLLRILGGLVYQSDGTFSFNDNVIDFKSDKSWHKRIGFVFQTNGLFPHLTGLQNITLPLINVFGMPRDEAERQAHSWLERFGLDNDSHKYPHQLSGGQCQRIAIIRAVIVKPDLLLLDEPTSALDPEYTAEVLDMIHELTIDGQNIILVTHEMGFARSACQKVMFLHCGKLLEYEDSKTLFNHPKSDILKSFLDKILEWK